MENVYTSMAFGISGSWLAEYTLTAVGAGVLLFDSAGRVTQWNVAGPDLLGVSEEVLGGCGLADDVLELRWSDGVRICEDDDPVQRVLSTGDLASDLTIAISRQGQPSKWLTLNLMPIFGVDREPRAVLASVLEGTRELEAMDPTASSRSTSWAMFHDALTANLLLDRSGVIVEWNEQALRLLRRTNADMIGCRLADVCDIDTEWLWETVENFDGDGIDGETWALPYGADEVSVHGRFSTIDWPDLGQGLMVQLIGPLNSAGFEALDSSDKSLLQQVVLPLMVITDQGEIVDANVRATELLGQPRRDLLGKHVLKFLGGLGEDKFRLRGAIAQASHEPVPLGRCIVGGNGSAAIPAMVFLSSVDSESPSSTFLVQMVESDSSHLIHARQSDGAEA